MPPVGATVTMTLPLDAMLFSSLFRSGCGCRRQLLAPVAPPLCWLSSASVHTRGKPIRRGRRRYMEVRDAVTYELRDRVAWVGLNRPQKRNAINDSLLSELESAARRRAQRGGPRAGGLRPRPLLLRRPRPFRAPRPRAGRGVPPFPLLAPRLRRPPPRSDTGDRGAARRDGRRRAGTRRRLPPARRRRDDLLRPAGGIARHLCRRRRVRPRRAADRRPAHDGHDAHRPRAGRRDGGAHGPRAIPRAGGRGAGQGGGAGGQGRGDGAAHRARRAAGAAAHPGHGRG